MLLDLQRILLGGTRLIGAIRDYTDPTTVTTWKSKKDFSRGGLVGFGMASNFQPRVSLTKFTQVSFSISMFCPVLTASPSRQSRRSTTPEKGASMVISIFIDSKIINVSLA